MDRPKGTLENKIFRRVLNAYFGRGMVFRLIGDHDAACHDFTKFLHLAKKAKYLRECGQALYEIGYVMYLKTRYVKALNYYQQAVKILKKIKDNKMMADVYSLVAVVYRMQGKYAEAVRLIKKAIAFFRKGRMQEPGRYWNALGHTYWRSGDFTMSLRCYKKALKLSSDAMMVYTTVLNNLGLLYASMKKIKRALNFHMQALKIRSEINDKNGLASSYLNIGNIYMHTKQYDQAKEYWQKAIRISQELRILDVVVMTQNNIGELLSIQGNYREAIEMFEKTIEAKKRLGMRSYLPSSYYNLARTCFAAYKKHNDVPMLEQSRAAARNLKIISKALKDKFHLAAARKFIAKLNKKRTGS